jgi:hypothetical protein
LASERGSVIIQCESDYFQPVALREAEEHIPKW